MPSSSSTSIAGGLPTVAQDVAPSAIFLVLYSVTNAICIWRLVTQYRKPPRIMLSFLLIHLFQTVRIVTMILRIIGAINYTNTVKGTASFNLGLTIAEQVLLSLGYLMIASTLVNLTALHESRGVGGVTIQSKRRRRIVTVLFELAILVAIVLGILAGTEYGNSLTDASAANTVRNYREISAIIVLVVLVVLIGYNALLSTRPDLPKRTSIWLIITSALLIVVPAYRLAEMVNPPSNSDTSAQKAAFYILQIAVEWLTGASLLAVNAKEWCGVGDYSGLKTSASEQFMMGEQVSNA